MTSNEEVDYAKDASMFHHCSGIGGLENSDCFSTFDDQDLDDWLLEPLGDSDETNAEEQGSGQGARQGQGSGKNNEGSCGFRPNGDGNGIKLVQSFPSETEAQEGRMAPETAGMPSATSSQGRACLDGATTGPAQQPELEQPVKDCQVWERGRPPCEGEPLWDGDKTGGGLGSGGMAADEGGLGVGGRAVEHGGREKLAKNRTEKQPAGLKVEAGTGSMPPQQPDLVTKILASTEEKTKRLSKPRLRDLIEHEVFEEGDRLNFRSRVDERDFPCSITNRSNDVDRRLLVALGEVPLLLPRVPLLRRQQEEGVKGMAFTPLPTPEAPTHLLVSVSFFKLLALWYQEDFVEGFRFTSDQHAYDDKDLVVVRMRGLVLPEPIPLKAIRDQFAEDSGWDVERGVCGCQPPHPKLDSKLRRVDSAAPRTGGTPRLPAPPKGSPPLARGGPGRAPSPRGSGGSALGGPGACPGQGGAPRGKQRSSEEGAHSRPAGLEAWRQPGTPQATAAAQGNGYWGADREGTNAEILVGGRGAEAGCREQKRRRIGAADEDYVLDWDDVDGGAVQVQRGIEGSLGFQTEGGARVLNGAEQGVDAIGSSLAPLRTPTAPREPVLDAPIGGGRGTGEGLCPSATAGLRTDALRGSGSQAGQSGGQGKLTDWGEVEPGSDHVSDGDRVKIEPPSQTSNLQKDLNGQVPTPFSFDVHGFIKKVRSPTFMEKARQIAAGSLEGDGPNPRDERKRRDNERIMSMHHVDTLFSSWDSSKKTPADLTRMVKSLCDHEATRDAMKRKFEAAARTLAKAPSYMDIRRRLTRLALIVGEDMKYVAMYAAEALTYVCDKRPVIRKELQKNQNVRVIMKSLRMRFGKRREKVNAKAGDVLIQMLIGKVQ